MIWFVYVYIGFVLLLVGYTLGWYLGRAELRREYREFERMEDEARGDGGRQ